MTYQVTGLMDHFKMRNHKTTLVIGINSGIGIALAKKLTSENHTIHGTTRNEESVQRSQSPNLLHYLDLNERGTIETFTEKMQDLMEWDNLIFCPATMEPIGPFKDIDIMQWANSFDLNFTNQIYLLRKLLISRNKKKARVLFFAGGGTNSSPKNYTCYTISKIALIKTVEMLDNEMDDVIFTIVGPGWLKTKIHAQSLNPSLKNLASYKETKRRLDEDDFGNMDSVIDSIMWILNQHKAVVGGRNFSSVHDPWGSQELEIMLKKNPDAYKLRRHSNSIFKTNDSLRNN